MEQGNYGAELGAVVTDHPRLTCVRRHSLAARIGFTVVPTHVRCQGLVPHARPPEPSTLPQIHSYSHLLALGLLSEVAVEEEEERLHLGVEHLSHVSSLLPRYGGGPGAIADTAMTTLGSLGQHQEEPPKVHPERSHRQSARCESDVTATVRRTLGGCRTPGSHPGATLILRELTFFFAGSVTPVTMRLSSLRMALAATPVVADLKSCGCQHGAWQGRWDALQEGASVCLSDD